MRNLLIAFVLAVVALSMSGCLDKNEKVTLNPDGSGKLVLDAKVTLPPQFTQNRQGGPDMKEVAKKILAETVRNTEGVDAWEDLSYELLKDDRVQIKGIVYFPSLEKMKLSVGGMKAAQAISWKPTATNDGMELLIMHNPPGNPNPPASQPSDEAVEAELAKNKRQWQQLKPVMTMMLGGMRFDTTYLLPGTVKEQSIFKPVEGGVNLVFDGAKVQEAMDKIMSNDELLRRVIKTGKNPMGDGTQEELMQNIFGVKGPARVLVTGPMKPQFDYQAQMTKAKQAQPEMEKKLGLDQVSAGPLVQPLPSARPARPAQPAPAPKDTP